MADTGYIRAATRRELRERRLVRQESRRAQCSVLSALDGAMKGGSVYNEPDVNLLTPVPHEMLPKESVKKPNNSTSLVKSMSVNDAYAAAVKTREKEHPVKDTRAVVNLDKPLPLSWDVTNHGKNDTSKVNSTLTFTRGEGDVPAIYKPGDANARKELAEKKAAEKAKRIEMRKPPPAFEYKPLVTKLNAGDMPRVLSLVPAAVEKPSPPRRPASATAQAKPFR
jgi:hypothetical protein